MQWVKINAAAIGIVNRVGQQVIKINRHCQYHDHPCVLPAMFKEKKRYYSGNQKMDARVKRGVNNHPQSGWLGFTVRGRKDKSTAVFYSLRL